MLTGDTFRALRLEDSPRLSRREREKAEATGYSGFGKSDDPGLLSEGKPIGRQTMVTGRQVHCPRQRYQPNLSNYAPPSGKGFTFRPYAERCPLDTRFAPEQFAGQADWLRRKRAGQLRDIEALKIRLNELPLVPFEHRGEAFKSILLAADACLGEIQRINQLLVLIGADSEPDEISARYARRTLIELRQAA